MSFRGKLIHLIEEKLEEPTDEYLEDEEEKEEEENVDNKSTVSGQVSVKTATADDQTNKNHSHIETSKSTEQMVDISLGEENQPKKKHKEREVWSGKFDFILSVLGYAVGLGSVWRFPYLCYRNGGGVFLIPYFIFLFLIGIPLTFLELSIGQYTSHGPITCFKLVPIFRGLGLSMNIVNGILNIYYNMIIAYSIYFLILSFRKKLPWESCNPEWSSPNCVDNYDPKVFSFNDCIDFNRTLRCDDGRCYNLTTMNGMRATCNSTIFKFYDPIANTTNDTREFLGYWNPQFPSQDYWIKVVLQKSAGIEDSNGIVWQLMVSLIAAWIIVFLMVARGISVSGKLVYFTSLFPYVVLLILGIRGWMLPGADIGVKFLISPDFSKLRDVRVWSDAASQIFFVMSISFGGLVALSSYNKFNNNLLRDTLFVSFSSCLTGVFAGFVVFSYIGYLSHTTGQTIGKIIQAGQGLSFVVFPFAVTTIKGAPFWSILFFFMMIVLGLDTMMAGLETLITSVMDVFPYLKRKNKRKFIFTFLVCLAHLLIGILFCLRSGTYWIEYFDFYTSNWSVLAVGATEAICVSWFYGMKNFRKSISLMIGPKFPFSKWFYFIDVCLYFVTPAILLALVVMIFLDMDHIKIGGYVFPLWTHISGQILTSTVYGGTVCWGIYMIVYVIRNDKPFLWLIKPDLVNFKPRKKENHILHKHMFGLEYTAEEKDRFGITNKSYVGQETRI